MSRHRFSIRSKLDILSTISRFSCPCQTKQNSTGQTLPKTQNDSSGGGAPKPNIVIGSETISSPTICGTTDDLSTLVQVTIVFRHGDRTPDSEIYPTSPNKGVSFFPYTVGGLKMIGQVRMYNVGTELRTRYGAFLGEQFYPDMLLAKSSSYERCMMSMQCVLAGLFPPKTPEHIPQLRWQAIPYQVIPFNEDKFLSVHRYCRSIYEFDYPEETDETDLETIRIIQANSGYEKVRYLEAFYIYDHTKTSMQCGLEVPDWVKPIYPNKLYRLWLKFWNLLLRKRKRLIVGGLIKQISEYAQAAAEGESPGRKIIMYAGHDLNLQMLRMVLETWNGETIDYGAYMVFELHKIKNVYGFKIFFRNRGLAKLEHVPGEGEFIPLYSFIERTQNLYIPEAECDELDSDNPKQDTKPQQETSVQSVLPEKPDEGNSDKIPTTEEQDPIEDNKTTGLDEGGTVQEDKIDDVENKED